MEKLILVHQLFIGKVADEIGLKRTTELLKESKEAFANAKICNSFEPDNKTSSSTKCKCGREKWEH